MIQIKGGNGSSKEKAIVILEAKNEKEGIDAEHNYIERKYGYFELNSTTFTDDENRQYDNMNIISVSGEKKEIWFDITDFYGKE